MKDRVAPGKNLVNKDIPLHLQAACALWKAAGASGLQAMFVAEGLGGMEADIESWYTSGAWGLGLTGEGWLVRRRTPQGLNNGSWKA